MEIQNKISIDPNKLFTKKEYSKKFDVSRPTIDKRIKLKELKYLRVNGTTLIIAD